MGQWVAAAAREKKGRRAVEEEEEEGGACAGSCSCCCDCGAGDQCVCKVARCLRQRLTKFNPPPSSRPVAHLCRGAVRQVRLDMCS
jgi:hypothetical protein